VQRLTHAHSPLLWTLDFQRGDTDILGNWANLVSQDRVTFLELKNKISTAIDNSHQLKTWEILDLSGMGLRSLPPSSVWQQLQGLTILDLSGNQLTNSELEKLAPLTSLQQLYLSANPLHNLPSILAETMKKMSILEIDDCKIASFPDVVLYAKMLDTLNLSNNPISNLPDQLGNMLPILANLSISNTAINYLPTTLKFIDDLKIEW
jgi:Leucine-rich repeat (LRR) protein